MSGDTTAHATRVPAHGGGRLVEKWQPGQSGNLLGKGLHHQQVRQFARHKSLEATKRLAELIHDPDGRVAIVACNSLLERAFGKPKDYDPSEDKGALAINTDVLTNAERRDLLALLRRGLVVPADDAAEGPVEIEGRAEKPDEVG